ncbi:hypothetical protein [Gordonia aurantiaca]|uniref:hypothetical protein n=1 Tax=Gordonia sp. B21 TaxID=3151852 RepID=UPI00326411A5
MTKKESRGETPRSGRLWPIVQIVTGLFIASQPYYGWISWWRGEIDPSGGEIAYIIGFLVVGLIVAALGVRRLFRVRKGDQ